MTGMTGYGSPSGRRGRCRAALGAMTISATALLVACSADATDFRVSAESFIEGDTMAQQAGTEFRAATCTAPPSTEPGTTFDCEAVAADGVRWVFEVTIVDESNFEIAGRGTGAGT